MYAATGAKREMNGVAGRHWSPRWRWPCIFV